MKNLSEAKATFESNYKQYCSKVTNCIKARLEWSDLQLIRDIITILATQGWQKMVDEGDEMESTAGHSATSTESWSLVERVTVRFKIPLENAGTDVGAVHSEFREMVDYAIQFFSLSTMDYQAVWRRLFHSPCSSEWKNCLNLAELLFSLPEG